MKGFAGNSTLLITKSHKFEISTGKLFDVRTLYMEEFWTLGREDLKDEHKLGETGPEREIRESR